MINIEYKNIDFNSPIHQNSSSLAHKCSFQIRELIKQKSPKYNIFCIDNALKQIASFQKFITKIKDNYTEVLVVGMGGSTLNPRTLIDLSKKNNSSALKIHFIDNTDPIFLKQLLSNISLQDCVIVAISNSGQTVETNTLVGALISLFQLNNISDFNNRFYFVTNPYDGMLHNIGIEIGANIIPHSENISGRFSGLTNVSTFIASLADIVVDEYINGANEKIIEFMESDSCSSINSAVSIYAKQKPIMVNLGYLQQFQSFLEWYSQIIAESLGKNNSGITPVYGLGPNDQHSMLQLYIEGMNDKLYSFFYVENLESEFATPSMPVFENLANKNLADINTINFNATLKALQSINRPLRIITLPSLSAKIIGELVVHSMFETIILAHMMKINPFDQPGVQLIKDNSNQLIK